MDLRPLRLQCLVGTAAILLKFAGPRRNFDRVHDSESVGTLVYT